MSGVVVLVFLLVLAVMTVRYGADSRDGADWRGRAERPVPPRREHSPRADAVALRNWLGAAGRRLGRAWRAQERAWETAWLTHQPWRGDDGPLRWEDILARTEWTPAPPAPERPASSAPSPEPSWPGRSDSGAGCDELRWRWRRGSWRLEGRLLPRG